MQATTEENIQLLTRVVNSLSRPQTPTHQDQQQASSVLSDYKQPSKSFLQKQSEQQNPELRKVLEQCITIVSNQNGLQANQQALFQSIKQAKVTSHDQTKSMKTQQMCFSWFLIFAIVVLIAMQAYHEFYQFRRKHYISY